jgi:hypothetical protein
MSILPSRASRTGGTLLGRRAREELLERDARDANDPADPARPQASALDEAVRLIAADAENPPDLADRQDLGRTRERSRLYPILPNDAMLALYVRH